MVFTAYPTKPCECWCPQVSHHSQSHAGVTFVHSLEHEQRKSFCAGMLICMCSGHVVLLHLPCSCWVWHCGIDMDTHKIANFGPDICESWGCVSFDNARCLSSGVCSLPTGKTPEYFIKRPGFRLGVTREVMLANNRQLVGDWKVTDFLSL